MNKAARAVAMAPTSPAMLKCLWTFAPDNPFLAMASSSLTCLLFDLEAGCVTCNGICSASAVAVLELQTLIAQASSIGCGTRSL